MISYELKDTIIHKLDPRTKAFWFLILTLAIVISDNITLLLIILAGTIIVSLLAKIPPKTSSLLIISSIVVIFVISIFVYLDTYDYYQTIDRVSVFGIKLGIMLFYGVTFITTTNPLYLSVSLVRLRIPKQVAFVVGIGIRMLPMVLNEWRIILNAQRARGYEGLSFRKIHELPSRAIPVLLPLLVSVLRMSNNMAISLESKGFHIEQLKDLPFVRMRLVDWGIIAAGVCIALLLYSFTNL